MAWTKSNRHRHQAVFERFVKFVCSKTIAWVVFKTKPCLDQFLKQCCCQHQGLWWFWLEETGPQVWRNIWWDSSHLSVSTHLSENARDYQSQKYQQTAEVKGSETRQTVLSCQEPSALGNSLYCSTAHTQTHSPACSKLDLVNWRKKKTKKPKVITKVREVAFRDIVFLHMKECICMLPAYWGKKETTIRKSEYSL